MNIGIIGAGNVGGTLGQRWASSGHRIKFGVRHPGDQKTAAVVKRCGPGASAGHLDELAGFSDVVVLTTPWDAARSAIEQVGNLAGKILIDCTNPVPLGAMPFMNSE